MDKEKSPDQKRESCHRAKLLARLRTPLDLPIALFLLSVPVGLWAAYDRALSWSTLITIVSGIVIYYMITCASRSGVPVWSLSLFGILGSVVIAIYFVTQSGHLEYPEKLSAISYLRGLTRIFPQLSPLHPNRNSVAVCLEGWLPLTVAMTCRAKHRWSGLLMALFAATLALAILLSASRGAWLALALCLPLWWATRSRRNLILAGACTLALVLAAAGYTLLANDTAVSRLPIINQTLTPLLDRPDRLRVYQGSWYLIQDFPFTGIGLGKTFAMVYSRYVLMIQVPFLTYSHNLFMQIWLSHGLLGIVAFGWLTVAFFLFVWRVGRQGGALLTGSWLGVATIMLHGFSDARQYADEWTFLPFFALLGLAMAAGGKPKERPIKRIIRMRKVRGVVTIGILGALLVFARRPLTAMAYANAGALSQVRGELGVGLVEGQRSTFLEEAAAHYGQAIAMDQDNRTAHQRLGVLAMESRRLSEALVHLEAAYQADPANTTTHKALGLVYAWAGHLYQAEQLLADVPHIVGELNWWGWWWGTQGKQEWAANAYQVSLRLRSDQPSIRRYLAEMRED